MTDQFWPQPAAAGGALGSARIRQQPEDFFVEEIPSWAPDGAGEHDVLWIEKRNANTRWVAAQLAKFAGCRERDVSFAGLKDRYALTRQWFSVHRPGRQIDWSTFAHDDIRILERHEHSRKLRIGTLAGNRFVLHLRDLVADEVLLSERIAIVAQRGMPNYFGPQRFGRDQANLDLARQLAEGRRLPRARRGFAISAARAAIFNQVLAVRVRRGDWWYPIAGDAVMLNDSRSFFPAEDEQAADALRQRAIDGDLHPSGPLWGRGRSTTLLEAAKIESNSTEELGVYCAATERGGAEFQRRALRVIPGDIEHSVSDATLTLSFSLPAGSFATSLLNELLVVEEGGGELDA